MALPLIGAGLAAILPGIIGAAGSLIGRAQSRGDIARQNAYNHPAAQVARLREAGLPMSALTGESAGNQAANPITSGEGVGKIGSYVANQQMQKQMELLDQEIRVKKSEADVNEATTQYWLSQQGKDPSGSNLTNKLRMEQDIQLGTLTGQGFSNRILGLTADNTETRQNLENSKLAQELAAMGIHMHGSMIDNKIKQMSLKYQEGMSQLQMEKLAKDVGLIDEHIKGAQLDNAIKEVTKQVQQQTMVSQITQGNYSGLMSMLTYDRVGEEFQNYKDYMKFVQSVQDGLRKTPWERITNPWATIQNIIDLGYTTIAGPSGQTGSILNTIR